MIDPKVNSLTTTQATLPTKKPTNDQQKVTNGFRFVLDEQTEAAKKPLKISDIVSNTKIQMPDGESIDLADVELRPVQLKPPATVESLHNQASFDVSDGGRLNVAVIRASDVSERELSPAEQKEIAEITAYWEKRAVDDEKRLKEAEAMETPEGQKKYLMSKQVDSVARDSAGEIVAKLYKDGSFMCSNQLAGVVDMGDGRSYEGVMRQIEKQPNITVTHYKNQTDFDLLPEEIASAKKQLLLPVPERYSGYNEIVRERIAFSESLLAL